MLISSFIWNENHEDNLSWIFFGIKYNAGRASDYNSCIRDSAATCVWDCDSINLRRAHLIARNHICRNLVCIGTATCSNSNSCSRSGQLSVLYY